MDYPEILKIANAPSKDDGYESTDLARREAIVSFVGAHCPAYELIHDGLISLIFKHKGFEPALERGERLLVISSHLDEVYTVPCFHRDQDASEHSENRLGLSEAWRGTFDNSATNAAALHAMHMGTLPPSALVAFEGNEEGGMEDDNSDGISGAGVYEVMTICKHYEPKWGPISLVVVLDVTPYKGGRAHFTLENYFVGRPDQRRLSFHSKRALIEEALRALPGTPNLHDEHPKAGPDSSWDYDDFKVNVLSLCMPVMFVGDEEFEDPRGQIIFKATPSAFTEALNKLTRHFCTSSQPTNRG